MEQQIHTTLTPNGCVIRIMDAQIMVIRPENDEAWCAVTDDFLVTYFDDGDDMEAYVDAWIDKQFDRLDDDQPVLFTGTFRLS